jgi:hypothetical protein
VVKYRRQGREERAVFRGGIVCISKKELHDDELLGKSKCRVHTLNYEPSDAQFGALMLGIADRGWATGSGTPEITPDDARTVAHYLIGEMLRLACRFDLRLLVNKAFPDYRQSKDEESECDWRDLITASIDEHLIAVRHSYEAPVSREARKEEELYPARDRVELSVPGRAGPRLDRVGRQVGAGLLPPPRRDAVTFPESTKAANTGAGHAASNTWGTFSRAEVTVVQKQTRCGKAEPSDVGSDATSKDASACRTEARKGLVTELSPWPQRSAEWLGA